jgi:enoyl-CoA hydratase/carnithine racemase
VIPFPKEYQTMSQNVIAAQRLWLTADKEAVVADGDERAASLYAAEGDEIPAEMAEKFGLVDGALPEGDAEPKAPAKKKAQTKPAPTGETKPAGEAQTKGA